MHSKRLQPLKASIYLFQVLHVWTTHRIFRPDYLFGGRAVSGLAIGALTHVVPMYLAEISSANVRGSLVALQQLSITLGVSLRIVPRHVHES